MRPFARLLLAIPLGGALACSEGQRQAGSPGGPQNSAHAQTPMPEAENTPERAAARSLATLRQLSNEQTYRELGFESAAEAERTTLGEPLRVFFVRLDRLRQFAQGDSARELLTDANRYVYPVLVEGKPRSAVTVELLNGRWEAVGFGGAAVAGEYAKLRELKAAGGRSDFIAVQVPAMRLNFLGHGAGGSELMLTPLPSNTDADRDALMFRNDKAIIGFTERPPRGGAASTVDDISPRYRSASSDKKAGDIFSKLAPKAKEIRDDVPR